MPPPFNPRDTAFRAAVAGGVTSNYHMRSPQTSPLRAFTSARCWPQGVSPWRRRRSAERGGQGRRSATGRRRAVGAALGEATYTGTMSLRRWLTGRWPAGVRSHSPPEHRCQLCHVAIAGTPVCALVADDTVTAAGDTCLA